VTATLCSGCRKHAVPSGLCFWCLRNGTDRPEEERDTRPFSGPEEERGTVLVVAPPEDEGDLVLYDYQERAVDALRANIRAGVRNQVLCAPTGSGKTVIATYLIREAHAKGKRAIFLADRIALIDQTSAVLDKYGVPHGVIQANHWRWRPHELVQVASPQTLERRTWPEPLDLIVVDECHTSRKVTKQRIRKRDCVTIGLTATPFTRGMGRDYDAVVSVTTTNRLIEERQLAPFRAFAPSEPDMTGAKVSAGEWTDKEAESRAIPIVGDCVREYLRHADGRKFLAFGATIAHCEELQRQFLASGVHVALYTSHTPGTERTDILTEFRKPDSHIRGLASVAALSKGFDVEDVSCIIMARPLRSSLAEHVQILGRGLRRDPADPSKECLVLDHAGNMVRFWDDMHEFFEHGPQELDDGKRKEKKKGEKPEDERGRKCPQCHHVHGPRPTCPNCGHEYPRKVVQHEEGELVEVGSPVKASIEDKQSWYSQLLGVAHDRGYKEGWAAHKYRERFGVWPASTLHKTPEPANLEVRRWVRHRQIAWAKRRRA
jgi:DNA repair protein RadD